MDWLDGFLDYTDGTNCPDIFRLWTGISAIAGAMERRIDCKTAQGSIYANQFILLVATPGVGKTEAIKRVSKMWYKAPKLHVAPDSMTSASIIDNLVESDTRIVVPDGLLEYHSMNIAADELGVFITEYATDFLSKLTKLYDNPDVYREKRRHFNGGKEIQIIGPQINLLAGAQPGFLSTLLPEQAWSQGFMSRFIMVYSDQKPVIDIFTHVPEKASLGRELLARMVEWGDIVGTFQWEPAVTGAIQEWYGAGMEPAPTHSRLTHYSARRLVHCIKLAMIAALSRSNELVIRLGDFMRARDWLLEVERKMPDVFRAMEGRSDSVILDDLHYFMWPIWTRGKKPIPATTVYNFLSTRTTSDKIHRLVDLAERAGHIIRQPNAIPGAEFYIPRPKSDHGLE